MSSSNSSPLATSTSACDTWIKKRDACRAKRGDKSEKCCQSTLKAKRCLAFEHCPVEAQPFYGETNGGIKDMCSAYMESDCFGNPRLMAIDSTKASDERTAIFEYHQKAKRRVGGSRDKFRECRAFCERLSRCLQKNGVKL